MVSGGLALPDPHSSLFLHLLFLLPVQTPLHSSITQEVLLLIHLKGSLEGTGVLQVSAAWGSSLISHQDPLPGCPWTGLDAPSTWEPVGQAVEKPGRGMLSGCSWGEQEGDVCLWTWASPRGERASWAFDQHIPAPIGSGVSGWPLRSPWWLNLTAEGRNLASVGCPLFSGGHLIVKEKGKGPRVLDQGLLEG